MIEIKRLKVVDPEQALKVEKVKTKVIKAKKRVEWTLSHSGHPDINAGIQFIEMWRALEDDSLIFDQNETASIVHCEARIVTECINDILSEFLASKKLMELEVWLSEFEKIMANAHRCQKRVFGMVDCSS
jgi:hypothetical protein